MCRAKEHSLEKKVKAGNSLKKSQKCLQGNPYFYTTMKTRPQTKMSHRKSKASTVPKAMIKLIAETLYMNSLS